ncbi:MAG: ribonuclease III [Planctomycetota bacterium]
MANSNPGALSPERLAQIEEVERRIGYVFKDRTLAQSALRHASSASSRVASNERLEFLGDAILGMVVCERLYHEFPDLLEGELTRIKSVVVSRETCAKISTELELAQFLQLGKGMIAQPNLPRSLLADVLESLVAAIFLDDGLEPAERFIERFVFPFITTAADTAEDENYKSRLQHLAQRDFSQTPTYVLVDQKGPDHSKSFRVAARIGDMEFEAAWGKSKKQAEQIAAKHALSQLEPGR